MHVFSLILLVRRRELGLLRAVGASRADILRLQVLEAGAIGLVSGSVGVGLARAAAALSDRAAAHWLPDLTVMPATLFSFDWKLAAAVLILAVTACVMSAVGPARRAASGDPAEALSGR
jgi:putative ABC transport system permease protein